jgi:peptidoglycan hydrolase-like protein with peptidoglycan-binding domain
MTRVMPLRALAGAAVASALLVGVAAPAHADTAAPVTTTVVAPRVAAPSAAIAALPVLTVGNTGTFVRRVQVMLHITNNAVYDASVKAAVVAFQKKHGLRANGIVGAAVWAALIADWRIYLRTPRVAAAAAPTGLLLGEPAASRNRAVTYSLRGVYASAYTGAYYDSRYEAKRRCIVSRESHGYYTVRSANGLYNGAYQMTASLGVGATKKMLASVAAEVGATTAASLMAKLRLTTPNKWSRYWQDRAFWTIFNHGAGASHWAGGYVNC